MNLSPPNDPVFRALAEWRVQPTADPEFRPAVWRRIHQRSRETWATYIRGHLAAWSVAALMIVAASGWWGASAGKARLAAERDAMAIAYLVELDPRVQAGLHP